MGMHLTGGPAAEGLGGWVTGRIALPCLGLLPVASLADPCADILMFKSTPAASAAAGAMMCCRSGEELQALRRSRQIDKLMRRQQLELRRELKLLLLGAGESGKSTIVKQMKIIHGDGYSAAERRDFIPLIHQNLITSMKSITQSFLSATLPAFLLKGNAGI